MGGRQVRIRSTLASKPARIASGKLSLARAVACEFEKRGQWRSRSRPRSRLRDALSCALKADTDTGAVGQARRITARLATALLAEDIAVVVEGEFLDAGGTQRLHQWALPPGIQPRFVILSISFEVALERARNDETRGLSRIVASLRDHYAATAQALRDVAPGDLVIDTGATAIREAACAVADWALLR